MKMSKLTFEVLETAVGAVVAETGKDACKDYADRMSPKCLRWGLFHKACKDLQYSDDHPLFADGSWKRIFPYCQGWYDGVENLNDAHIDTALRVITKKLGVS